MLRRVSFVFVLLAAVTATAAAEPDRDGASAAALAFYRHYAGGDLDGALALTIPGSPAAVALRRRARLLRTHCFTLGRLEAASVRVAGRAAAVEIEAEWLDSANMPGAVPVPDFADGTLALRRDGEGWRIAEWTPAAVRFGDILAGGGEAARAAALANPRIRCRAAVRELARRAIVLMNQSKFDTAAVLVADAHGLAAAIGDDAAQSLAFSADSALRRHLARDNASLELALTAVALAERCPDADALARALLTLERARHGFSYERPLALRGFIADAALIAQVACLAAQANNDRGDHWTSLQFSSLALRLARESGDDSAMLSAEMNIADTYHLYNDHALSQAHWRNAAEIARRAGFTRFWIDSLLEAAAAEWAVGRCSQARALLDRIPRQSRRQVRIVEIQALCAPNDAERAPLVAKALRMARAEHNAQAVGETIGIMIDDHLRRGEAAAALSLFRQTDRVWPGAPALARYGQFVTEAEIERRLGHQETALRAINAAITIIEGERSRLLGDARQQRQFSASRMIVYKELAAIRAAAGQPLAALSAADDGKARTLLDLLGGKRGTFDNVMSDDERRHERELRERAAALRRRGAGAVALARSRIDIDDFEAAMAAKYPQAVPSWSPPATVDEALLRKLLPDAAAAIVEFSVTSDRLYAFTVRRDAHGRVRVHVYVTAIRSDELFRRVGRFSAALARADVDYRAGARRLFDLLLAPLPLRGAAAVCIVPDSLLWELPFEALIAPDGRFFVEHAAPFYAPSIAAYARALDVRPRGEGTFFALADPPAARGAGACAASPLPDAEREVRTAAQILGGRSAVYVGAAASLRRLEAEAAGYRVIHFATHGVFDDTDPMYSYLVFAPSGDGDDGVLEAWQMMRMRLSADLAVLSACDTARGADGDGEGAVGMAWALFVAGCPSTIATRWKIASAPAADLLIDFYRQWKRLGDGPFAKAAALARAQRNMLHQRGRRHPFYWAPFILIGAG